MKRILLPLTLISFSTFIFGQSGAKWATNGNATATGDFIGTTNNFPLDFKTNNVLKMSLGTNGVLKLSALSGANTRLLQVDANGNIISLPQGNANQYLSGTGAWVNVPNVSNLWSTNGSSMYYNNGYVGIGTSTPLFPLDVIGDARVTNNLYVGGGIVISDKVKATTEVKGWDIKVENDLSVESGTRLKGLTRIDQGFTFDGINGMKFSAASGSAPAKIIFGSPAIPLTTYCAAAPNPGLINYFGGMIQLFDQNNINNTGLLNLQTWTGGSSIDASTGGQTTGGLLLNYFCHSPTFINTGWDITNGVDGGRVYMGAEVEMQRSLKIGWNGNPSIVDANTSIEINQNTNNSNAVKVKTFASNMKAFSIEYTDASNGFILWGDGRTDIFAKSKSNKYFVINDVTTPGSPVESFAVYGTGKTEIKIAASTADKVAFSVTDLSTNKMNFRVKSDGFVHAREVEILNTNIPFPDYVFAKDYNLLSLTEVEKYISNNKHLPGFENADYYEKNGIKSSEMFVKQQEKIEELTLYIIELEKRMKAIEESTKH